MEIFTNCGTIKEKFFLENPKINCQPDITHSHIPFVHQMFCRWAYQPALQFLWVLVIEAHNKNYLLNKIAEVSFLEPPGWNTHRIIRDTWTDQTQNTVGCIFAQAVNLPGESVKVDYVGLTEGSNRGFINAPIINGRENYQPMEISFLDTNQSFVDGVLRPWSILIAHEGLLARPRDQSLKADIHVYQLAKAGEYSPNIIIKAWTFKDCVPVNIIDEKLTYNTSDYGKRQAQFVYNSYHLNQDPQAECGGNINNISTNTSPQISNRNTTSISSNTPQTFSTNTNQEFINQDVRNLA
jgi:hypothetical protein